MSVPAEPACSRGPPTALVVGGSRGIGAATVRRLAMAGWRVVFTYRTRDAHARRVIDGLGDTPERVEALPLNIAEPESVALFVGCCQATVDRLDLLVLSAAAGMEPGAPDEYAWKVNAVGPLSLVRALAPVWRPGGRVVYVTSHEAHFFGRKVAYGDYVRIAASKRAGELRLLEAHQEFADRDLWLQIVSADIVEDSPTAKLLELRRPGLLAERRSILGQLPTSADVAEHICNAAAGPREGFGDVTFVWDPRAYVDGR